MRTGELRRALEGVLLAVGGGAVGGCCDLTFGAVGAVPGYHRHVVVAKAPPAAAREGRIDGPTCQAICGEGVVACRSATTSLSWEASPGRLTCLATGPGSARSKTYARPLPGELRGLTASALDAITKEPGGCARLCLDELVYQCGVVMPVAPPPGPDERYVVCEYDEPSHCPDWLHLPSGRAPSGLAGPRSGRAQNAGDVFARASYYEEASVGAFMICARELAAFGAPASFVVRARSAAGDERRHATWTLALARRHGGTRVPSPRAARRRARTLAAFATENVVEGCIGETFGALFALRQASAARDEVVRRAMAVIARDELRHAALAWAIHRWCGPRLRGRGQARVESSLRESLLRWHAEPPFFAGRAAEITGLPTRQEALCLAAEVCDRIAAFHARLCAATRVRRA